jgi:hypothetical protein
MAILTKSPNSKLPKSYTIEPDVNDYVEATKGDRSASKRTSARFGQLTVPKTKKAPIRRLAANPSSNPIFLLFLITDI